MTEKESCTCRPDHGRGDRLYSREDRRCHPGHAWRSGSAFDNPEIARYVREEKGFSFPDSFFKSCSSPKHEYVLSRP